MKYIILLLTVRIQIEKYYEGYFSDYSFNSAWEVKLYMVNGKQSIMSSYSTVNPT